MKEIVTDGSCPRWLMLSGMVPGTSVVTALSGTIGLTVLVVDVELELELPLGLMPLLEAVPAQAVGDAEHGAGGGGYGATSRL